MFSFMYDHCQLKQNTTNPVIQHTHTHARISFAYKNVIQDSGFINKGNHIGNPIHIIYVCICTYTFRDQRTLSSAFENSARG